MLFWKRRFDHKRAFNRVCIEIFLLALLLIRLHFSKSFFFFFSNGRNRRETEKSIVCSLKNKCTKEELEIRKGNSDERGSELYKGATVVFTLELDLGLKIR